MHVRQVVLRQDGGDMQIDFGAMIERAVQFGLSAGADGLYCALQHFRVQGETDFVNLAGLLVAVAGLRGGEPAPRAPSPADEEVLVRRVVWPVRVDAAPPPKKNTAAGRRSALWCPSG